MLEFSVTERVNVHTERGKEYALLCSSEYELWCLFTWVTKPSKAEVDKVIQYLTHAMSFANSLVKIKQPNLEVDGVNYEI